MTHTTSSAVTAVDAAVTAWLNHNAILDTPDTRRHATPVVHAMLTAAAPWMTHPAAQQEINHLRELVTDLTTERDTLKQTITRHVDVITDTSIRLGEALAVLDEIARIHDGHACQTVTALAGHDPNGDNA